jgi:hypothetical protein
MSDGLNDYAPMNDLPRQPIPVLDEKPQELDTKAVPQRRRFKVSYMANEKALETYLNRCEEQGRIIGDIFIKPTGGFAVLSYWMENVPDGEPVPENKGEHKEDEQTEDESFQGDPPEAI